MDVTSISLVQGSFAKVWPIKGQAARIFYDDLFTTSPDVIPLFADADMQEQGEKLMATLNTVVRGLTNLTAIVPVAEELARRHVRYGVAPEHYNAVGASLIRALEQGLGADFTPEVRAAWTEAYDTLAAVMKAAAYPPPAAN